MTFCVKYSTLEFATTIFYLTQCMYCFAYNFTPHGFHYTQYFTQVNTFSVIFCKIMENKRGIIRKH
nr:MAG TPA: hypothetical protein [Caudoviricetes sp.]